MSRDDQKHVSGGGLHVYQDPKEDGRGIIDKLGWL